MTGKEKCGVLKKIRREIAKKNDIPLEIPECTHKGDCKGTCPRCEAEVKFLEKSLAERKNRGLKIAVAGISAGLITLNTAGCDTFDALLGQELQGDMRVLEEQDGALVEKPGELVEGTTGEVDVVTLEGEIAVDTYELQGDLPAEELE